MSKVIYKYEVLPPETSLDIPADAVVVKVDNQHGDRVMLWVEQNPDDPLVRRRFLPYRTGDLIPDEDVYVGTAVKIEGSLVIHVYERGV